MAEEEKAKASDAVRITRIVAPTVLIIALALIFKGELSGSMNRGCFEISIEHAGIDLKDNSLCSMNDVNQFAGQMTEIGATTAEQRADSAFAEFEALLTKFSKENETLQQERAELAEAKRQNDEKAFELARALEQQMRSIQNRETKMAVNRVYNQFVEVFDVPPVRIEEEQNSFQPAEPQQSVQQVATDIRSRYIKKTDLEVKKVQEQITIKRK